MGKPFKRNVWCGQYAKCLDRAVETGESFNCEGCYFQSNQEGKGETIDAFSPCLFVVALFFPKVYQAYRKYQAVQNSEATSEATVGKAKTKLEALIKEIWKLRDKGHPKKGGKSDGHCRVRSYGEGTQRGN